MRFNWSEQQLLIQSMLERYVADRHGTPPQRGASATVDRAAWRELAELGLLGLPFREEDGGMGGTALDTLLVMEAFGRGLVRLPYLSTVILAGGLLRSCASAAQRTRHVPPLVGGELLLAFAFAETRSRYNPGWVETSATADGDGFILSGRKIGVLGAPDADACFITARTSGAAGDRDGISLFLVPSDAIAMHPYATIDGAAAAEILLENVHVPSDAMFGEAGTALPAVERALDEATAALCADAAGAMEALNTRCTEFAQTRHAFGQPIAGFQAIQHRLVDMRIAYEMSAALTVKAAAHLAEGAPAAARTVSAAKALVGDEAGFVAKNAVQLHGAIGITEELDIGHYFKRLTAMQLAFGGTDHHLRRCIALDAARATSPAEAPYGH